MENKNISKLLLIMKEQLKEINAVIGGTRVYWQGEIGEQVRNEFTAIIDEYTDCISELMDETEKFF